LFYGNFGAARIFSTALDTMKFLSDTRPIIGFSSFNGTGTFLAPGLAYLFAISYINYQNLIQKNVRKLKMKLLIFSSILKISVLLFFLLSFKYLWYLRSSSFIVPVPFNLNWEALGLAVPFGNPKEAPPATVKWEPLGA
jgi:hypothetical protein